MATELQNRWSSGLGPDLTIRRRVHAERAAESSKDAERRRGRVRRRIEDLEEARALVAETDWL